MDNTEYLLALSEEWRRIGRLAQMEEVFRACSHHRAQALTDLLHWRDLHHDHILRPRDGNEDWSRLE